MLGDFPIDQLPAQAADYVRSMSAATGISQHLFGPSLIGAVFAAAIGRFRVRDNTGHWELLTEYIMPSASSGFGKSEVINHLREPFEAVQKELQHEFASSTPEAMNHARSAVLRRLEADAQKKVDRAIKAGVSPEDAAEQARSDFEQIAKIRQSFTQSQSEPKLLLDRVTMSQLPYEMALQSGVSAIIDAESEILQQINPKKDSIVLKGFTGERFSSGIRKDSVSIEAPCLTLCLLCQPHKLLGFYGNIKFVSDGLAARFLPVIVRSDEGIKTDRLTAPPQRVVEWYGAMIRLLLASRRRKGDDNERATKYLDLTPEANSVLMAFRKKVMEEQKSGRFENCDAFAFRLPAHACRLAGALRLMAGPDSHQGIIDGEAMRGGVALAEYFTAHAVLAFTPSVWDALKLAPRILQHIRDNRYDTFTAREAQRWVGSGRYVAVQVKAALDELESSNMLRRYITASKSVIYVVHPRVFNDCYV